MFVIRNNMSHVILKYMNLYEYSSEIQELSSQLFSYADNFDMRAFDVLKKLEKLAKGMNDRVFSGFVYHNYAGVYFDHNNHEKTFYYIKKALYELLRSDERQLIARTYNLFSIESQNFGCFDIAYQYHRLASIFIENEDNNFVKAIIKSNGGDLFTDMGDSIRANTYIKEGLELLNKCVINNVIQEIVLVNINLGLHSIYSNKIKEAKSALKKIEGLIKKHNLEDDEIIKGWLLLFKAFLSIELDENKTTKKYVDELINNVILGPHFVIYMKDIYRFCESLIVKKKDKMVEKIIMAIRSVDIEKATAYSKYLILQLYISYYSSIKDNDNLLIAFEEKNGLLNSIKEEENLLHYESIQLMGLIEDLRKEELKAQKENEALQLIAETDALTGIPNRNAINKMMEISFQEAIKDNHKFGIGVLDIDSFKLFNDTYGHLEGDKCLKKVANALKEIAKENDLFVARYGGDEFVLIYKNLSDQEILEIEDIINKRVDISISHGFYNELPKEKDKAWDYFALADKQLYVKKRNKK